MQRLNSLTMVIADSQTGAESVSAVMPTADEVKLFATNRHSLIGMWSAIKRLENSSSQSLDRNHEIPDPKTLRG